MISLRYLMHQEVRSSIASFVGNGVSISLVLYTKIGYMSYPVYEVLYKTKKSSENEKFSCIEDAVARYNELYTKHTSDPVPAMRYKVGDQVAFVNRAQDGGAQTIDAVDPVCRLVRTRDYKWWSESCFMPYSEWEQKHGKR